MNSKNTGFGLLSLVQSCAYKRYVRVINCLSAVYPPPTNLGPFSSIFPATTLLANTCSMSSNDTPQGFAMPIPEQNQTQKFINLFN